MSGYVPVQSSSDQPVDSVEVDMEMAERGQPEDNNGDKESAAAVPHNFITNNLFMGDTLQPCTCYGIIERKWAVTSNARPKYVRFATNEGFEEPVIKLLSEKWKLGTPNFIFNIFGGDVPPKSHKRTKALLELCDEVNAWTFLNPDHVEEHLVHLKCRKKKKTSRAVASNIVVVKPWESLSDEQKEELTPTTNKPKMLHKGTPKLNFKVMSLVQQSRAVLFPEMPSDIPSFISFTKSLAKHFDNDGHREQMPGITLHVCPIVNFVLVKSGQDIPQEVLDAEVPTVVMTDDENLEIDKAHILVITKPEITSLELKEVLRDHLTENRKLGITDKQEQKLFRRPEYLKFYLNLQLGLKDSGAENCEDIITATKQEGIRQKLGSLIHFYRHYDLLDFCLKSGYEESLVLHPNLPGDLERIHYILSRAQSPFTEKLCGIMRKWMTANEKLQKDLVSYIPALKSKLSDELNEMLGHGTCDYTMSLEDAVYIFNCFNYDWDLVKIIRQHSPNRLLKCYLALGALVKIRDRSSRGKVDCNEVDDVISEISNEVLEIAVWVDKDTDYDIGPMIFLEHKHFSWNSIMTMVKGTECYSLLSMKSNVYNCIKNKWNGAIDIHTSYWQIVFGILTLGLLTPRMIKFVTKNSVKKELDVFLSTTTEKKGYWEKWKAFWTSCRTKCFVLMITYLAFLLVMTLVVLDNTRIRSNYREELDGPDSTSWAENKKRLTILIGTCAIMCISFLLGELDIEQVSCKTFWTRLKCYLSSSYNKLDIVSSTTFLLYTPLALFYGSEEGVFLGGKALVSLSYVCFFIRFTLFLQMFEVIGPKIITIKKMLGNLMFFVSFLILAMFGYGIVSEFLLHPMPKTSSIPGALEVIKRPYINMFGELDLDNFEAGVEEGVCQYESALNSGEDKIDCSDYTCSKQCIAFKYTARILLGGYSLTTVVLLTNLLISIFSKTYETDYDESQQLWQIQCYKLIKESENHFVIPLAPLNAIYSLYKALWILKTRLLNGPKNDHDNDEDSTEWYVRELDRRIYEQFRDNE